MKCATDQSKESTEDKCNEVLFVRLLLIHGPDPEPFNPSTSPTFRRWWKEVKATCEELGGDQGMIDDYWQWLCTGGLSYVPGTD